MVDLLSKSLGENSFCRYIVQAVGQRMLFILAVFTLAKGYPSRTDFLLSNPRQMDNNSSWLLLKIRHLFVCHFDRIWRKVWKMAVKLLLYKKTVTFGIILLKMFDNLFIHVSFLRSYYPLQAIYNWWVYKEELRQTSPYTAEFHLMSSHHPDKK